MRLGRFLYCGPSTSLPNSRQAFSLNTHFPVTNARCSVRTFPIHIIPSLQVSNIPAMASPVSIGDVIMLSKLAFRLGHAFTSGRKSAPAEFQEVQNQLYSLSKALEFLVTHKTTHSGDDSNSCENTAATCRQEIDQHDEFLGQLIINCRKTLSHLESLVDKYSELTSDCEEPGSIGRKKWRTEMKDNWKRIRWTIEGGNLDELRGNLAVHINSLNLAVSAINK